MSFEQHWTLASCSAENVVAAVRSVAGPHELSFHSEVRDDRIVVSVKIPVEAAAELAAAFSDLYDVEEAESELDALEGEVDVDAATRAGVVTVQGIEPEDADRFRAPAPSHYSCSFDIVWSEDPPVVVYSNDGDNRAAWPAIIAFVDAVVERLGGGWVEL